MKGGAFSLLLLPHPPLITNKYLFTAGLTEFSRPGPGCSKLTTSLVNVSLKFQMLISEICQYFLLKKCSAKASLIYSTKNFSVFGYKVVKHLTS